MSDLTPLRDLLESPRRRPRRGEDGPAPRPDHAGAHLRRGSARHREDPARGGRRQGLRSRLLLLPVAPRHPARRTGRRHRPGAAQGKDGCRHTGERRRGGADPPADRTRRPADRGGRRARRHLPRAGRSPERPAPHPERAPLRCRADSADGRHRHRQPDGRRVLQRAARPREPRPVRPPVARLRPHPERRRRREDPDRPLRRRLRRRTARPGTRHRPRHARRAEPAHVPGRGRSGGTRGAARRAPHARAGVRMQRDELPAHRPHLPGQGDQDPPRSGTTGRPGTPSTWRTSPPCPG